MVLKNFKNPTVKWIGNQERNVYVPQLSKKEVLFYKECYFGLLTLKVGDFVLISNADAAEPDTVSGCDVGKILYLYELIDCSKEDPCRAIVQWYSRPDAIPRRCIDNKLNIDFNLEVIEDYRFDNDVSIETIFNKCNVIFGNHTESAIDLFLKEKINKKYVTFVCRYKLLKVKQSYKLLPLISKNENEKEAVSQNTLNFEFIDVTELDDNNSKRIRSKNTNFDKLNNNEIYVSQDNVNRSASNRKRLPNEKYDPNSISPLKKSKSILNGNHGNESTPRKSTLDGKRKSVLIETPKFTKIRETRECNSTPRTRCKSRKSLCYKDEDENKINVANLQKQNKFKRELNIENSLIPPNFLPCREKEFNNIYTFLLNKIQDQSGGCMYISGVPGTGKTATVTSVIKRLKYELKQNVDFDTPEFEYVEINGMRLSEPRQAYVQIYKQLTGKVVSWTHAQSLLEKRFTTPSPRRNTTVLLVDELDILCNRRQDVIYNLLDWPNKAAARLVVIAIANTMDLPERVLRGKVTSRLGLTRLTFSPYTYQQLQEIVNSKLSEMASFQSDALQLIARKVAAVSGDARRALDISKRAIEIYERSKNEPGKKSDIVNMNHIQKALSEMISNNKVQALKHCSTLEKCFLQAIEAEMTRKGIEETIFIDVYTQFKAITSFVGVTTPSTGNTLKICSKLGAERLIICEHSRTDLYQKILLNVSKDDIHYALEMKLS